MITSIYYCTGRDVCPASIESRFFHISPQKISDIFNRAKHAVVEAAILPTRTAILPLDEIGAEYRKLAVLIDKTGGAQERAAFDLLRQYVQQIKKLSVSDAS